MKILLVEDDLKLGKATEELLTYEKCLVDWATDGVEALNLFKRNNQTPYDIIILDWMLPELNGIDVCKALRGKYNYQGGILFVTAKGEVEDCVKALDVGSDDFMVKPVKIKELLARLNALCRRKNRSYVGKTYEKGAFKVNSMLHTVYKGKTELRLRKKEFALFELLFVNQGNIIPRELIFEKVWEDKIETNMESLDSHIYSLRKKIRIFPEIAIKLVKNVGYMLEIKND